MDLAEQVKALLEEHFSGAIADVWQDPYSQKVNGHLVWEGFDGQEQLERQQQVASWLRQNLGARSTLVSTILTYSTNEYRVMSLV